MDGFCSLPLARQELWFHDSPGSVKPLWPLGVTSQKVWLPCSVTPAILLSLQISNWGDIVFSIVGKIRHFLACSSSSQLQACICVFFTYVHTCTKFLVSYWIGQRLPLWYKILFPLLLFSLSSLSHKSISTIEFIEHLLLNFCSCI